MSISNSGFSSPRTTENPWLPIDTMPLSTVGADVDVKESRRLYSNVHVTGIRYEREVVEEQFAFGEEPEIHVGRIADFTITHTTGTIRATLEAEWRPHV